MRSASRRTLVMDHDALRWTAWSLMRLVESVNCSSSIGARSSRSHAASASSAYSSHDARCPTRSFGDHVPPPSPGVVIARAESVEQFLDLGSALLEDVDRLVARGHRDGRHHILPPR